MLVQRPRWDDSRELEASLGCRVRSVSQSKNKQNSEAGHHPTLPPSDSTRELSPVCLFVCLYPQIDHFPWHYNRVLPPEIVPMELEVFM